MLSVRRALLSASIIPVMLKGSITAFYTVPNITIRTLPSLPARVLHLQPNQHIATTVRNRTFTTPSRQAQPQAVAGVSHSQFLSGRHCRPTTNCERQPLVKPGAKCRQSRQKAPVFPPFSSAHAEPLQQPILPPDGKYHHQQHERIAGPAPHIQHKNLSLHRFINIKTHTV